MNRFKNDRSTFDGSMSNALDEVVDKLYGSEAEEAETRSSAVPGRLVCVATASS